MQVKALQADIAAAQHEAQQLEAQHQHLKRQQAALQVGGAGLDYRALGQKWGGWSMQASRPVNGRAGERRPG